MYTIFTEACMQNKKIDKSFKLLQRNEFFVESDAESNPDYDRRLRQIVFTKQNNNKRKNTKLGYQN